MSTKYLFLVTITTLIMWLVLLMTPTDAVAAFKYVYTFSSGGSPGGERFGKEVSDAYVFDILRASKDFVLRTFQQLDAEAAATRKPVQMLHLFIENFHGVSYNPYNSNEIHISATYFADYSGDVKKEFTGLMYYEMARVWQWNGNGWAPSGLSQGIGDFVRLRAGYAPSNWAQPGQGDSWKQGFDVTARFLDYCEVLRPGFVAELNKKMKIGYSDMFLWELTGKNVDQLWSEYKAHYAN